MLNRAARYFPILRELRQSIGDDGTVLDVGSGPTGIGEFWTRPFVGCDVSFPISPKKPMRPVICSGTRLPFPDRSFDAVVASDVMEHVPPEARLELTHEVLRVARKTAIFGYPCGREAFALDQELHREYLSRKKDPPIWLQEHMLHPFPDERLFEVLPDGWSVKVIPNEKLAFHYRMMLLEMRPYLNHLFRLGLVVVPRLIDSLLQRVDREPSYRKIFVVTRQEPWRGN